MSAQPQPGGMADANRRIALLLEDLEGTVESVEMLTRLGRHEEALRVVDHQRAKLYRVVDSIASDVGARRRSRWQAARRHIAAGVAAAAVALSALAVVGPGNRIDAATDELDRAVQLTDAAARLAALSRVFELTQGDERAGISLRRDLEDALNKTRDELEREEKPSLAREADRMVRELQQGRVPAPPQSNVNPVDEIKDQVQIDCAGPTDADC